MGRWAQRRRSGGSPSTPNNEILTAAITQSNVATLTYARVMDAGDLTASDFESNDSEETGTGFVQVSSNVVDLAFTGSIGADSSVTYTGTTPGFRTPQTVNYT